MFALRDAQSAMVNALRHGPSCVPDGLFSGPLDRVLLGLKVHANTISHARLVALEESFPMTRDAIGLPDFNALCRAYLDAGGGRADILADIGRHLPDWMVRSDCDPQAIRLARFEWAWLQCFHAANGTPLALADIAALGEADLLGLLVVRHPAVRLVHADAALCQRLGVDDAPFIVLSRPKREVMVFSASRHLADLTSLVAVSGTIGSLLTQLVTLHPDGDPVTALQTALDAGLLITTEPRPC